jgi:hypothetical protein
MKERIQRYIWSKGRASAPSGNGPKFGSKCDHRCKKVWHFCCCCPAAFFVHFFLSCVSLSLALLAPNLEHALTISPPLPCLHMYSPMTTYIVLSPQVDVLPSLRLVLQDAQARETHSRVRISLVIVWPGPPPTLPNYNFVYFNLFVFVCVCLLQLGRNNPFGLPSRNRQDHRQQTVSPPPQNLVFPFLCCLPCLVCLSSVLFMPFSFVLCSFLHYFSSFVGFFAKKRSPKKTPQPCLH